MLFIFVPQLNDRGKNYLREDYPLMKIKSFIAIAAAFTFAIVSFGCGGAATNTSNTAANKPANTTSTTTTSSTTTTAPTNTAASTTADSSSPNTGVPECDEYITKYEACLTEIAKKAPQAEPGLKSSFEAQRNGFKAAASTPQGKTMLAGQCKGFIDTAKKSTAQWCTNW